jgi:hypothetical protein
MKPRLELYCCYVERSRDISECREIPVLSDVEGLGMTEG